MAPGAKTTNERTIKVEGRFDAFVAQEIRSQVADEIEERPDTLVIDLSDVSFVDSAGLAVLVWGRRQMTAISGDLVVIRPRSEEAFRVFELTRFDKVFTIRNPS